MSGLAEAPTWPDEVYGALRSRNTTQFCFVPDSGHRRLIERAVADPEVHAIPLTCEEEGVGVLAGAHLGLARGVLLMQSSGVGNCINFLSLIQHCRMPFLALVTMRGEFGEQNPWQYPMGQAVQPTLNAMGVLTLRCDHVDDVRPTVEAAIGMVDRGGRAVAVLLGQRLIGAKKF
jgi:sulfopyruvate decarboxylase alpha subunit